jgi:hypothetical protein
MAALQLGGLRLYCDVLAPFGGLAGCNSARAESASWYASGPNGALTYVPSATDMARDRSVFVGRSLSFWTYTLLLVGSGQPNLTST